MPNLKLTTWNLEWLDKLFDEPSSPAVEEKKTRRKNAIREEVEQIDADILCILEGPKGEDRVDTFCQDVLNGDYVAVKADDGEYATKGRQWIWFLVKPALLPSCSLLPTDTYKEFTGASWKVNYWGDFETATHRHYRHPQVLVLDSNGTRIEFIGLHTKSKFVMGGQSDWNAGGERKEEFIRGAIKARIKLTTEVQDVRRYINRKFEQTPNPAIFVLGDLNDGPGKEFFERQYLFFDLLSNLQGDVFFARRFLNHALFDFPEHLRWTVDFDDFVDPERDPHILLDHILFTQSLVDGSLPWKINSNAGLVEHEIHELVNATVPQASETSDHRPVSVNVTIE